MNKDKKYGNFIYLLGAMGIVLVIGACSPERDEYSFPPMLYDEQAYLREIAAADDLITLNVTRSNYAVALKKSETVTVALQKKWDLLAARADLEGRGIGRLCDEVELIEFDFEKIARDYYRLHFLFRITGQLRSRYGISIMGRLADPDLLPEANREKGFINWHFNPLPPTKFWEEGEYLVVSHDIPAQDLPLELRMSLVDTKGKYGEEVSLGVMGQLVDLSLNREKILSQSDPFQLWDWLQYCHARSGPPADLIRGRYLEVTGGLSPEVVVEEGIEYYGAKVSRISPDRCRLQLLFRATEAIDRDYWITIYGLVAPEDRDQLSPSRLKAGKKGEQWYSAIYPPTSNWRKGEYIVVNHDLEVAPIAYDCYGFFYDRKEKKAGPRFELGILDAPGQ